jgi:hypothetical protein
MLLSARASLYGFPTTILQQGQTATSVPIKCRVFEVLADVMPPGANPNWGFLFLFYFKKKNSAGTNISESAVNTPVSIGLEVSVRGSLPFIDVEELLTSGESAEASGILNSSGTKT